VSTKSEPKPEIVTSIRLSRDEHAFLKKLAASQQRTITGQIRFMVAQLRDEPEPNGEPDEAAA
jgi:hypothetical protein